jgi:hypothetical protein
MMSQNSRFAMHDVIWHLQASRQSNKDGITSTR